MDRERQRERALALYDEGSAAKAKGDLHLAVQKLREAIALLPTATSLAALGKGLLGLARDGEAIVHLAAALGLGAGGAQLRLALAEALIRSGDRSEALRQLRIALQEEPGSSEVRGALQRLLTDSLVIAGAANRHRLLAELRVAVPELTFDAGLPPADALALLGRYVVLSVELGRPEPELAPAFAFLHRLAVSPDQEVADLLTGCVFPVIAERRPPAELAQRMLVGKARAAFDDALALWGAPSEDAPTFTASDLLDSLRLFVPALEPRPMSVSETPLALAHHLTDAIVAGRPEAELADGFRIVSRMGGSRDPVVEEAFARVSSELIASREPAVIRTVRRLLTGAAHQAFERELGWE